MMRSHLLREANPLSLEQLSPDLIQALPFQEKMMDLLLVPLQVQADKRLYLEKQSDGQNLDNLADQPQKETL